MLSSNGDKLTSSPPNLDFFLCLFLALDRTSNTTLNKSSESGHDTGNSRHCNNARKRNKSHTD